MAGGSKLDSMLNYRGTAMPDTSETQYEAPAVIATEVLQGMLFQTVCSGPDCDKS
jgi:hypothetical protein